MADEKRRATDKQPASADKRKARAVREIETTNKTVDQVRQELLRGDYDNG